MWRRRDEREVWIVVHLGSSRWEYPIFGLLLSTGTIPVSSFAMEERGAYAMVAGQVIQRLRGNTSQAVLAVKAGLSQSALSRFENGQSTPDLYELRRLAHALGHKPGKFVELIDQAFIRTSDAARKVSGGTAWNGFAAAAIAGLAILGAAAMLEEEKKKRSKGR